MNTKEDKPPKIHAKIHLNKLLKAKHKEKSWKQPQKTTPYLQGEKFKDSRFLIRSYGDHLEVAQYLLDAEKLFRNEREIKTFSDEEYLREYIHSKPTLKC